MPSKGKSPVTTQQRGRIAAGRVSGKTSATIAAETGLSESTVRKQAVDPRTVTLIQKLKSRDEAQLDRIWKKTIRVIEEDLDNGDPGVRGRAARTAVNVIAAGDPPLARLEVSQNGAGDFTLEELLATQTRILREQDARAAAVENGVPRGTA